MLQVMDIRGEICKAVRRLDAENDVGRKRRFEVHRRTKEKD